MNPLHRKVDRYDGQIVWIKGSPAYELGNYLGGGAAGVVYESVNLKVNNDMCALVTNLEGEASC
jgi:hypothetical protein